jgi:outer membrane receptor protein involved in Fe transport
MLLGASASIAQSTSGEPLRGQLVDQELGEPIAGALVRLDGTDLTATTDEQGRFVFASAPQGPLTVIAEGPVIEPIRVEVSADRRSEPLVLRAVYASIPEYTITVVASRPRPLTASTSHVTAREMAAVPRRNAEDALRLVPGLTLVQHGSEGKGHQFFLRGFDAIHGADLELTVDGIPVNEWSNIHAQGYIDLGFVIPEVIESVEVTKGPFTLGQGAFAMAGSADYQLGIPEPDRGFRSTYTIGTTNRHRGVMTYTPRAGDGQDFIAAEALHDDGFGMNRAIDRGALLGRIRLMDSSEHGTLALLGSGYIARFALPGTLRNEDVEAGRVGFYDAYDSAGRGLSGRGLLALRHEWRNRQHEVKTTLWGGYRRLELLENYTGFLIDPIHGDRRSQHQDAWNFGANVAYDVRLSERFSLETGLGVRGDVLEQAQDHVDQREDVVGYERRLDGVQTLSHLRVGFRWRPIDSLRLAAGTRLDVAHVSVRDGLDADQRREQALLAVSPRVTAEWRAVETWRLFAAYGRGFRPPEARAFTSFRPDRTGIAEDVYDGGDPRMTVADSLEVGTRWIPNRYFGVRVSGFATFIERESVFDHVSGINLELNSTRRLGTELEVHSNPFDWLTLSADVTYVDARFVDSGNPVPLAPWLVGGFRAIATHESGWRGGLRFTSLAPRPLPHGARGAALTMLDATAGYRWQWLSIDLELENLLNQQIREGEYHYASDWRTGGATSSLPVIHYVAGPPFNARLSLTAVF